MTQQILVDRDDLIVLLDLLHEMDGLCQNEFSSGLSESERLLCGRLSEQLGRHPEDYAWTNYTDTEIVPTPPRYDWQNMTDDEFIEYSNSLTCEELAVVIDQVERLKQRM